VLRGDTPALRRILGARRGGRHGVVLALLGMLSLAASANVAAVAAAHVLLCAAQIPLHRRSELSVRENQRLLLWPVGLTLLACAVLRALALPVPPLAALAVGHALHVRSLRRGLERRGEVPREEEERR
jgi:hypothetical protein